MVPQSFEYRLTANAGRVVATLRLDDDRAVLDYSHEGMCEPTKFHLTLKHQPVTGHFGLLYVTEAAGHFQFPNPASEYRYPELLLEYVRLPEPAPFVQDDPGMVWFEASETFDLLLLLGRFFSGTMAFDAVKERNDTDLKMLTALFELDKMLFRSVPDTSTAPRI